MSRAVPVLSALAFAAAAAFGLLAMRDARERGALDNRGTAPAPARDPRAPAGPAPQQTPDAATAAGGPAAPPTAASASARDLVAALASRKTGFDWILKRLLACEPAALIDALRASWDSLPRTARVELLRELGWLAPPSPAALDVLDLGMADSDPAVLAAASAAVQGFALVDFDSDPAGYAAWRASCRGRTLDQIMEAAASDYLRRLRAMDAAALRSALRGFSNAWPAASRIRNEEVEAMVLPWLASGPGPDRERAADALESLGAGETFLRSHFVPLLDDPQGQNAALTALGHPANRWATPLLVQRLEADDEEPWLWVGVLEEIGDPRAVGPLIACLQKDEYGLFNDVNSALETLTGVEVNEAHDLAWWTEWWKRNGDRYPAGEK